MTKGQSERDLKTDTGSGTPRQNEGGGTAEVVVGNVPDGKKAPVILFSVLWVAWIVFLVCMMAM